MKDIFDIKEELEELLKYADLENNELGDYCNHLHIIATSFPDYMTGDFIYSLVKEIMFNLENFKKEYKIVRKEETRTICYDVLEKVKND
jgi:hypothetical protein